MNHIESLPTVVLQLLLTVTHNRHDYIVHDEVALGVKDIEDLPFAFAEWVLQRS